MGHTALVRAAGILVCALAVSLLGAATASARTQGFYVYNFTSQPIKLVNVYHDKDAWAEGPSAPPHPVKGDILAPGVDSGAEYDHNHIELNKRTSNSVSLDYEFPNKAIGTVGFTYREAIDTTNQEAIAYCLGVPHCVVEGKTVTFLDPPGTKHEATGTDIQKQAQVLSDLCNKRNLDSEFVTCDFDATRRDTKAFGNPHLIGQVATNCGPGEAEARVKQDDKEVASSSYGFKIGAEVEADVPFGKAKVSYEHNFRHEWGNEHKFAYDLSHPLPEHYRGWFTATNPVIRVWGDFTLTIGNTTWILHDVYFDFPDASRDGKGGWKWDSRAMRPDEIKADCPGEVPDSKRLTRAKQLKNAPAYQARITQGGTRRAEALFGGRESSTLIARGGDDILLGASGNDRLFGGPGRDLYRGGPGSETISDHRGRSLVFTGAGGRVGRDRVDVRDGEGDDRVTCGNRKAKVRADRGDRLRHCGK